MTNQKVYDLKQVKDAKELASILVRIDSDRRPMFALMLESMMIGAELAERSIAHTA